MFEITNLPVKRGNVPLRVARGHFATNHSHINYYIDITYPKTRLSEAQAVAKQLVKTLRNTTPIDTILCLDGTAVIGTCLAEELTKNGFQSINSHKTVYVVEPEFGVNNQMLFRDNIQPMIRHKHVLVLMASCTTGFTAKKGIETVGYYGGEIVGVAALYSMVEEVCGQKVHSVFSMSDLPDYASYDYKDCPYCKQGRRLDALVNSHGYSWL
ncbi:MAG: orotate phosphoribosyltransferase [Oscillospiraceae bacterium]|nr:orotate phosphoribosyltransferase [Oscillospiraceae bacterium]